MTTQAQAITRTMPIGGHTPVLPPDVLMIRGGKGGVGTTQIALNLAVALSSRLRDSGSQHRPAPAAGNGVLFIDARPGVGSATVGLGISEPYDLDNAVTGGKSIEEIICPGPGGISLLPAFQKYDDLAGLAVWQRERLRHELAMATAARDFVLVDTSAGPLPAWCASALQPTQIIVVTTPDPAALAGAYATVKELAPTATHTPIAAVVNMAASRAEAARAFRALAGVAQRFLKIVLTYLGWVPMDNSVVQAGRRRVPFVQAYAPAAAAGALKALAAKLALARNSRLSAVPAAERVEN